MRGEFNLGPTKQSGSRWSKVGSGAGFGTQGSGGSLNRENEERRCHREMILTVDDSRILPLGGTRGPPGVRSEVRMKKTPV